MVGSTAVEWAEARKGTYEDLEKNETLAYGKIFVPRL